VDDATTVKGLLHAAGFDPPEKDVPALVRSYLMTRQMVALLYAVDEAQDESPALDFRADFRSR
jgi:hypothetical protein